MGELTWQEYVLYFVSNLRLEIIVTREKCTTRTTMHRYVDLLATYAQVFAYVGMCIHTYFRDLVVPSHIFFDLSEGSMPCGCLAFGWTVKGNPESGYAKGTGFLLSIGIPENRLGPHVEEPGSRDLAGYPWLSFQISPKG